MSYSGLEDDINAMIDNAEPPLTSDCWIYKVPSNIRSLNPDAYTPKVISIGPFHYRHHPQFHNMKRRKLIYFKSFLKRTQTTLHTFIHYIHSILPVFNRYYSETLQFSQDELVKLILIDSCFIIELFWRSYYDNWSEAEGFRFEPLFDCTTRLDLVLFENQLPFFVIEDIYNLSVTPTNSTVLEAETPLLLKLTFRYFAFFNISKLDSDTGYISSIRHFTDLIRIFHLQHGEDRPVRINDNEPLMHLPSATELFEAGVRFEVNTESKCLLDFKFSGRVLKIPHLRVEDRTETLFRNMVALEQCSYPHDSSA